MTNYANFVKKIIREKKTIYLYNL